MLVGCSKSSDNTDSADTEFNAAQKSFLYDLFQTEYLWADTVSKSIDISQFSTPDGMVSELRYTQNDRWSFSQTLQEYHNRANQVSGGFGCYYDGITVRYVEIESPCDTAGIKRGDKIFSIDDSLLTSELYKEVSSNLGEEVIFGVFRNNDYVDIPITPLSYQYKSTQYQILTAQNNVKVGHMIFNSFTSQSADEINDAFSYFYKNNIEELIVDLRYNGGGSLATTSILMDKIAGYNNEDKIQVHLKWNDSYSHNDSYYYFEEDDNSLDLARVVFLTTSGSASASEVTINGLKPYMDVVLIGSRTHGKPVGMQGRVQAGLIYWLINFSSYNAHGEGDFYDGIGVDCSVDDLYTYERTDINDAMLSEALFYIENGGCKG